MTAAKWAMLGAGIAMVLGGCRSNLYKDDPDVAASYRGEDKNKYERDIVTARSRRNYKDQGKGIKPKTLRAIEDTITTAYERDFERCLEEQMGEMETRFLRSVFTVEFKIDTSGQASSPKVLRIGVRKQNAKGSDLGEVSTGGMKSCIEDSIVQWEFDPAPEVDYVHTYNGQVGEAF